jgi:HEAT repeat protein
MIVGSLLFFAAFACVAPPGVDQQGTPDDLVRELATLPASLRAGARSDGTPDPVETRRQAIYRRLSARGESAMPALARGLKDPDVRLRRNVALFLSVAGGGWQAPSQPKLNIGSCLRALTEALADSDARVRQLAAQAIGAIGPAGATAVPALVRLLDDHDDEGSRNTACIGLAGIGPAASDALPALRKALNDPSKDVRRFAQLAIDRISAK